MDLKSSLYESLNHNMILIISKLGKSTQLLAQQSHFLFLLAFPEMNSCLLHSICEHLLRLKELFLYYCNFFWYISTAK